MPDNLQIKRPADATKINIHEQWELRYWSKTLGVSETKIITAVKAVGPMVKDVKKYLGI